MRVSLKSVPGVDAVDVSLEKGRASVKMKPGNTATFKQLQEAITKNGFTMKPSAVNVAGKIVLVNGQPQLRVSGSNDLVNLIPDNPQGASANALADKQVLVEGTLNEAAKGKAPDTIRYHSIREEK
ncbi:MAG TPA: heavy metal-associated domain-containing protein [Candidatus Acidoferrum sp.]|nr:heavy metal-associated domain-containing protein [Candidatus Acidoferrum sp.]